MFVLIRGISGNHGDSPIPTAHNTESTDDEVQYNHYAHLVYHILEDHCVAEDHHVIQDHSMVKNHPVTENHGTPDTENPWKKVELDFVCWNYYLTPGPKRPFIQTPLYYSFSVHF